jgi:hypothetical protein
MTNKANKENQKNVRVVIIFKDKSQLAGTMHILSSIRLSDAINDDPRPFIPLTNVTYNTGGSQNSELETFLVNKDDVRGIIPIE